MFRGNLDNAKFFDGYLTRKQLIILNNTFSNIIPRLLSLNRKDINTKDSYFSYALTGNAPWSARIWDAISSLSIPIIFVDSIVEPFEKWFNYKGFTIKARTSDLFWSDIELYHKQWFLTKVKYYCEEYEIQLNRSLELSFIYRKQLAMEQIREWFQWDTSKPKNVFRLILFELWCRSKLGKSDKYCAQPSSRIANIYYY